MTNNDASYALRRFKRDAPELAQRVVAGELSANAAAITAGFRPRKVSINLSSAASAADIDSHQSPNDTQDNASGLSMCAQARLLRSRCPGNGSSVRIGGQNALRPGK